MCSAPDFFDPGGSALGIYDGPPDYAGQAKKQEKARQQLIQQGTQNINNAFAGFTPGFYDQRAQAYQNFALPQLSQQYRQTQNAIGFGMANRGVLGGGALQKQYSNLNREMGVQKQAIADVGRGQAQDLQKQVEAQRGTLINQLYQTADPTLAGLSATNVAASMAQPSVYAPLGNMFSNLLNQYYAKRMLESYQPSSYVSLPEGGYNYNLGALPSVSYGGTV